MIVLKDKAAIITGSTKGISTVCANRKYIIAPGQVLKTGMMYHFEGTFARSEYKKLENGVI